MLFDCTLYGCCGNACVVVMEIVVHVDADH